MSGLNFRLLQDLEDALASDGIKTERHNIGGHGKGYEGVSLQVCGYNRNIYVAYHFFRQWTEDVFGVRLYIVNRDPALFRKIRFLKCEKDRYWYGAVSEDIYKDLLSHLIMIGREFDSKRKK